MALRAFGAGFVINSGGQLDQFGHNLTCGLCRRCFSESASLEPRQRQPYTGGDRDRIEDADDEGKDPVITEARELYNAVSRGLHSKTDSPSELGEKNTCLDSVYWIV